MKVRCPKCGTLLKFRDENLGKHGKCPRCHHEIVAVWDDVVRPASPKGQPGRVRPMQIAWGCVAVFGLGAAGVIASSLATSKAATSPSAAPPVAQAAAAVPTKTETAAAAVVPTAAPTVASENVPTAQAAAGPIGATASVDGTSSTATPRGTAYSVTPPPTGTPSGDTTATGKQIYVGPRGGRYHYSASGRKVYERHRR